MVLDAKKPDLTTEVRSGLLRCRVLRCGGVFISDAAGANRFPGARISAGGGCGARDGNRSGMPGGTRGSILRPGKKP